MRRIVLPYSEDGCYRFGDLAWLISQALCPDDENARNWLRCVYTWRDDGSPDGLFERRLAPDGCLTENVLDANHWTPEKVQPSRVPTESGSVLFHWLWAEQRRGAEWHRFLSDGGLVIHCDDDPKRWVLEATRRQHMLQYEQELESAAQSGLLMVCNSSGLPLSFRHGEPLQNGVVYLDSLNEWGATLPGLQKFEMASVSTDAADGQTLNLSGTQPKLSEADKENIVARYNKGHGESVYALAKAFNVSRPTIDKALRKYGIKV